MSKITKVMIAASAAILVTVSTNSYSFTDEESVAGVAWVEEQIKHEENSMTDIKKSKVGHVRKSTNSHCYAKGEGIGGRAWSVEQAKCKVN